MQFPLLEYPALVENGIKPYEHLFPSPQSLIHCKRYLTGLMVSDNKTIDGMTPLFVDRFDQSSLNRFLTEYAWDEQKLNDERIARMESDGFTKTKPTNSVCALDDTLLRKYGSKTPGVGTFFDHKTNGYIKAHDLVTSQYADREHFFPINFRLYKKYPKREKQRLIRESSTVDRSNRVALLKRLPDILAFHQKELSFKDRNALFRELVDDAVKRSLSFEAFAFDNWYFNQDNVDHVQSYRKDWLTRMKSNTKVLHEARRTRADEWAARVVAEQREAFQPFVVKSKEGSTTYWCYVETKKVSMLGKQKCRIVISFNNSELKGEPVFIVTNNCSWGIRHILDLYALRWPIETFYRDSKLHLGLEDYQLRSTQGTTRHWYLVFLLDTILGSACKQFAFTKSVQGRARTIGEQCRSAVQDALKSLICWLFREIPNHRNPELLYQALMGTA